MSRKTEVKYLGDIISGGGSNEKNIENRFNRGLVIYAQVNATKSQIALDSHNLKILLLLRNTNLINGILHNSEVWHRLNMKNVKSLKKLTKFI